MAVNNVYRESWTKHNGWQVRVDFVPCGGDHDLYSNRSVTDIQGVFIEAKEQSNSFDKIVFGLSDAGSCKFTVNYSNAPSAMQTALDTQFATVLGYQQPNLFVVWSDRGTAGVTWYPEFVGNNTIVSEIKYVRKAYGLVIEVDAVSVHKSALENAVTASDIFDKIYAVYLSDTTTADLAEQTIKYYEASDGTYNYATYAQRVSGLFQYMVKVQDGLIKSLDDLAELLLFIYTGQAYTAYPALYTFKSAFTNKQYKFYKQASATDNVGTQGALLADADLWVCIGESNVNDYATRPQTGLLSDDSTTITSDSKNIWELLRQITEQLFLKGTPYYDYSGGYLLPYISYSNPYDGTATPTTYDYRDGQGEEPEFGRNANRLSKCKTHFKVNEADTETYEEYVQGMSDSGFEIPALFNIDIPTKFKYGLNPDYSRSVNYVNTRGLYYKNGTTFYAVCPRVDFQETPSGGFVADTLSKFNVDIGNQYISGATSGTYQLYTVSNDEIHDLRTIQSTSSGFRRTVSAVLNLFGRQNNQTKYEMVLPLSEDLCVENLGGLFEITPDADTTTIETEAFMLASEISWQATESMDDFVKCTFLTKSN